MRRAQRIISIGASLMLSAAASAQGFDGARVEARVGYDHLNSEVGINGRRDAGGLIAGAALGYDFDLGRVVIGAEADIGFSTSQADASSAAVASSVEAEREYGVAVRVGYEPSPATLLFASGGYTNGRFRLRPGAGQGDLYVNNDGFRVGGGLERRINRNAFVKGEYRYLSYRTSFLEPDRHQVTLGAGLRF